MVKWNENKRKNKNKWWRLFSLIFHDAPPPDLQKPDKSPNQVSDTRNLKVGGRQSYEQPIDIDEPRVQ
jgi:hypothetical protein